MTIDHVALWTRDLEAMKDFYIRYFNGVCSEKYLNPGKQFESYFISFDGEVRLELMCKPIDAVPGGSEERYGLSHVAFRTGSENAVRALTETLRAAGYTIVGEPRTTGDGYFESVVLDPEGNRIELTA